MNRRAEPLPLIMRSQNGWANASLSQLVSTAENRA